MPRTQGRPPHFLGSTVIRGLISGMPLFYQCTLTLSSLVGFTGTPFLHTIGK
jgi:hypothetical protein